MLDNPNDEIGNIKKVLIKSVDGRPLTIEDENATTTNFPMWFGDELIKEINEKDITVIIFKDVDNQVRFHLATEDVDLIIAVQTRLWGFVHPLNNPHT